MGNSFVFNSGLYCLIIFSIVMFIFCLVLFFWLFNVYGRILVILGKIFLVVKKIEKYWIEMRCFGRVVSSMYFVLLMRER